MQKQNVKIDRWAIFPYANLTCPYLNIGLFFVCLVGWLGFFVVVVVCLFVFFFVWLFFFFFLFVCLFFVLFLFLFLTYFLYYIDFKCEEIISFSIACLMWNETIFYHCKVSARKTICQKIYNFCHFYARRTREQVSLDFFT